MKPALMFMMGLALGIPAEKPLVEGNPQSPVRVLIFEDLQCSDCAAFRKTLDERLLPKYRDKVAFEHRDFPLAKHSWARKAAIASRFFQETSQELAIKYRRQTLGGIEQTTTENFGGRLTAFAKANGIDPEKALPALENVRYAELVGKDFQDGVTRGVSHTPTVFVNGEPFVETISFEKISAAIDKAIQESGQ